MEEYTKEHGSRTKSEEWESKKDPFFIKDNGWKANGMEKVFWDLPMPHIRGSLITVNLMDTVSLKTIFWIIRAISFQDRLLDKAPSLTSQEMSSKGFFNRMNQTGERFACRMEMNLMEV